MKYVILSVAVLVALTSACSPPIKAFQQANLDRRTFYKKLNFLCIKFMNLSAKIIFYFTACTQCKEIQVTKSCTSDVHNSTFECSTPTVDYSISISPLPCARATVTCAGQFGVSQNVGIVAKLAR